MNRDGGHGGEPPFDVLIEAAGVELPDEATSWPRGSGEEDLAGHEACDHDHEHGHDHEQVVDIGPSLLALAGGAVIVLGAILARRRHRRR